MAQRARSYDNSLLQELRQQTAIVHEQLHHHSHFVALFEQTIDLRQYRDLLTRFHGFYAALDQAIAQSMRKTPSGVGDFSYVTRSGFLEQDLKSLGLTPAQIAQNPRCAHLLNIVTPASLAGVLYVIEGSTLGAAQIDRAAQKLLSADTTDGRQFWAWSRSNNKDRWSMTLSFIAALHAREAAHDPILQGAQDTFQALADWLAPLQQPVRVLEGAAR